VGRSVYTFELVAKVLNWSKLRELKIEYEQTWPDVSLSGGLFSVLGKH